MIKTLFAAFGAAFLMATAAFAAESTTVELHPLWAVASSYLLPVVEAIVVAALGWLATRLAKWLGIQIEAKHREALHSAATTGVNLAFQKIGNVAGGAQFDARSKVLAEAARWVIESVPDALRYLEVTPQKVEELVASKLTVVLSGQQGTAPK